MHNVEKNIVFYDGNCLLCSRAIRVLLKLDKKKVLFFSPLQGKCIKSIENKHFIKNTDSILFWDGIELLHSSNALIAIIKAINFPKLMIGFIHLFPTRLLDSIYNFISRNRIRFFGKNKECFMIQGDEKKRFLE